MGINSNDDLLVTAITGCVQGHKEVVNRLISTHVFGIGRPSHLANVESIDRFKTFLHRMYFSARILGNSICFPQLDSFDLRELGMALSVVDSSVSSCSQVYEYAVSELFVFEAIEELFANVAIMNDEAVSARFFHTKSQLECLLKSFGSKPTFNNNLVERLVLERFVEISHERPNICVAELAFFPADRREDTAWGTIPFRAERVMTSSDATAEETLIAFLASSQAQNVLCSPGNACRRPDGILKLDSNRALTVGVAVYSDFFVQSIKLTDPFASTDLSRAYLNRDGKTYPSITEKRQEWCERRLHETISVRVNFSFPHASPASASRVSVFRELKVEGRSAIAVDQNTRLSKAKVAEWEERQRIFVEDKVEHDVIVNIDRTNLSLFFGERTSDMVRLLKIATGLEEGWEQ